MLCLRCSAGLALIVAGIFAGCKSNPPSKESVNTVTITAKDFAFDAPAEVPAGVTTMRLANQGTELHHAQLIRLNDGKTVEDLAQALKKPGPPPIWVKFVGGPNAVPPGKEATATAVLQPGRYAYLCFVFGPDGVMHVAKGMMRQFEVTGSPAASATLPTPDATIKLVDYDFHSSKPLTPGRRTILVENAGPQPHELALLKLAPGKKVEDFAHWAEGGMRGPPPAEPIGGVVFLDQGAQGTFTADLETGDYGLICFVPDSKDGKPHLAHGMMKTIRVG